MCVPDPSQSGGSQLPSHVGLANKMQIQTAIKNAAMSGDRQAEMKYRKMLEKF